MKKKFIALMVLSLIALTGCGEDSGVGSLSEVTDTTVNTATGSSEIIKTIEVNGQKVDLETSYSIQNGSNWKFTHTASIGLSISLLNDVEGYNFKVGSIYADVSIVSKDAEYHGLRQDSIFVEYKELNDDGIALTKNNNYYLPFSVEGINQNETFLRVYNGTGFADNKRLTEKKVSDVAYGAKLNVVWTIYIEDIETGQTYMQSVTDTIGLPVKVSE